MKRLALLISALLPLTALAENADAPGKTSPAAAPAKETKVTNVTPDEAEKLLQQNKQIVVLDVRTAEEYQEGHIAGAKNIDYLSPGFAEKLRELDPSKTYLVHCEAGGRSSKACVVLKQLNFTEIYHLKAGMSGWRDAGKPLTK